MDDSIKVTLVGNCQTKSLAWYIKHTNPSFDVKWICIEFLREHGWATALRFNGRPVDIICNTPQAIERLKSSDYVIYQPIRPETSSNFNHIELKKHASNAKLISISVMRYEPGKPYYYNGMVERAKKYNIDIPAHKLVDKYGTKITMRNKKHPHVFYYLEILREICDLNGWNYYSDKQYDQR